MKLLYVLLVITVIAKPVTAQQEKNEYCLLTGTITGGEPDGYLYLSIPHKPVYDRVLIPFSQYRFEYKIPLDETAYFLLYFKKEMDTKGFAAAVRFFAEPGQTIAMEVKADSAEKSVLAQGGGLLNKEFARFAVLQQQFTQSRRNRLDSVRALPLDSAGKVAAVTAFRKNSNEQLVNFVIDYAKENPSLVSAYFLYELLMQTGDIRKGEQPENIQAARLETIHHLLEQQNIHSRFVDGIGNYIAGMDILQPGDNYINFTLPDRQNKPVNFKAMAEGKIMLLDFWASWCSPCRKKSRQLVPVYEKYNPLGFDIFSVSVDTNKDRWLTALAEDKFTWTSTLDLDNENGIADQYHAYSLPVNLLIDKDGKIIAKNLEVEEIKAYLEKMFDN